MRKKEKEKEGGVLPLPLLLRGPLSLLLLLQCGNHKSNHSAEYFSDIFRVHRYDFSHETQYNIHCLAFSDFFFILEQILLEKNALYLSGTATLA